MLGPCLRKFRMDNRSVFTDEPDARFYIKEKEVGITPSGSKDIEMKSGRPSASGPSATEKYD